MDGCTIVIMFLLSLLLFMYYTMENRVKKVLSYPNEEPPEKIASVVGESVSSHDNPLRPTWIK